VRYPSQSLLISVLLNLFLVLSLAQQRAYAQKLNELTESGLRNLKTGDYRSAIFQLKQAVQQDPKDGCAWLIMGLSYGELREWPEALNAFEKSLSLLTLNPNPNCGEVNAKMLRDALASAEKNVTASNKQPIRNLDKQPNQAAPIIQETDPSLNIETLPPGFIGANPKDTVAQFKKIIAGIPIKIDEYSNSSDKAQFEQLAAQQVGPVGLLRFAKECHKHYDSNSESFEFSMFPGRRTLLLYKFGHHNERQLVLEGQNKLIGTYDGSNSFGVKRQVQRLSRTEISLVYPSGESYEPEILRSIRSLVYYQFTVPMNSSEARQNANDLRCLVLFKPTFPYLADYKEYTSPKIDSPYEIDTRGIAMTGEFRQLWIYNYRTGNIFVKLK
jgi:hypothetical protein